MLFFVCFFPLLVAGPIERATHLLPQVQRERKFSYELAKDGLKQILWGLFKKIAVADTCALCANYVFDNMAGQSRGMLIVGVVCFAFQIYGDFSGYSDIALGTAKLFGFELITNFRYPYFSRDIAEFWRRWHISLSSWFRDYLYIPLGGSRVPFPRALLNTFIIFIVSGFWHGANWTFIFWGALNAMFIIPLLVHKSNRMNLDIVAQGRLFPSLKEFLQILFTFILTCIAWIFFRANTISSAVDYLYLIFAGKSGGVQSWVWACFPPAVIMFILEWFNRDQQHPLQELSFSPAVRFIIYFIIFYMTIMYSTDKGQTFIYFQF